MYSAYDKNVFVNCPFDDQYFHLLKPLLFTLISCELNPQIAQTKSSAELRLSQITDLILNSRFSIHDISRQELSAKTNLPRFNMPFELGIDYGIKVGLESKWSKKSTRNRADKVVLILDRDGSTYKKAISDLAGNDIGRHNNEPRDIIKVVRNWLYHHLKNKPADYLKI